MKDKKITREQFYLPAAVILIIGAILFLGIPTPTTAPLQDQNTVTSTQSFSIYPRAPELTGISNYLNSDTNLSIASLRGKVVLVDFWTYSCINCIRTLPYLNDWYAKYHDKGLEIIGVHTPEFDFEKSPANVALAIAKYNIKFPVVMDNDYATWQAYNNHYWPHKYLIDANGYVRFDHIGEGDDAQTEEELQQLLKELPGQQNLTPTNILSPTQPNFFQIQTPEIYLGSAFARSPLGNPENLDAENSATYTLPAAFTANTVYLEGQWKTNNDSVELVSPTGKAVLVFGARKVHIVAGNYFRPSILTSTLKNSTQQQITTVEGQDLYTIMDAGAYVNDTLTIDINGSGFRLYTFTFG